MDCQNGFGRKGGAGTTCCNLAKFGVIAAAVAPEYLDGALAGDYGWDPLALGAEKDRLGYYRQAELQNGRWASKHLWKVCWCGYVYNDLQ
jgi:hypothetical protein